VQNYLFAQGLYLEPINGMITDQTMAALVLFQSKNGLPIGQFDIETLDVMEINY